MSPIVTLILDLVIAGLLVATIVYAIQLNRQLIKMREGRSEMEGLIRSFNEATTRAETGIKAMRRAAAETGEGLMIGQIQVLDLADVTEAGARVAAHKQRLLALANSTDPLIVSLHGGARDIEVRTLPASPCGPMLVVHLLYDCRDAMGANMINTACEALAPLVEEITGVKVLSLHHDISTLTGEEVLLFTLTDPVPHRDAKNKH